MSCSDAEDLEVKQENMDRDKVKSEEFSQTLKSEDPYTESHDVLDDAHLQTGTESGKLSVHSQVSYMYRVW